MAPLRGPNKKLKSWGEMGPKLKCIQKWIGCVKLSGSRFFVSGEVSEVQLCKTKAIS